MAKQELIQIPKVEYESILETLEIMSNKKLIKSIKEGIQNIKDGKYISFERLKEKYHLS